MMAPSSHPIIRIVRMTFIPKIVPTFLHIFDRASPQIRAFPGCTHLELWQDTADPHTFTSYSHWADAGVLEVYRHSNLFKETWKKTKPLFAEQPAADSYHLCRTLHQNDNSSPT